MFVFTNGCQHKIFVNSIDKIVVLLPTHRVGLFYYYLYKKIKNQNKGDILNNQTNPLKITQLTITRLY